MMKKGRGAYRQPLGTVINKQIWGCLLYQFHFLLSHSHWLVSCLLRPLKWILSGLPYLLSCLLMSTGNWAALTLPNLPTACSLATEQPTLPVQVGTELPVLPPACSLATELPTLPIQLELRCLFCLLLVHWLLSCLNSPYSPVTVFYEPRCSDRH